MSPLVYSDKDLRISINAQQSEQNVYKILWGMSIFM